MKTIFIKWRKRFDQNYQFYSEVPIELFRRYFGPIYPYLSQHIVFKVVDPIPTDLQPYLGRQNEIIFMRMSQHFYLIEGNILFMYFPEYPVALLRNENITEYKIGENPWQPIANANFSDQYCIASTEQQLFSIIGGQYSLLSFMDIDEISNLNLIKKECEELFSQIKVTTYLFQ